MSAAWLRTVMHQEPIIVWSCFIGGVGAPPSGVLWLSRDSTVHSPCFKAAVQSVDPSLDCVALQVPVLCEQSLELVPVEWHGQTRCQAVSPGYAMEELA